MLTQCWSIDFWMLLNVTIFFRSRTHFCRVSQLSLEFDYPLPFKEYSAVLYSTGCNAQAEVSSMLTSNPPRYVLTTLTNQGSSAHQKRKNNLAQDD